MDIDEFLDKELQAEKKEETEQEVPSQTPEEDIEERPVASEAEETDTIKRYFQLWSKISEAKFKWDDKLYTELEEAGNNVKEELNKSLLTAERDKKGIKRLIGNALAELENKNYEAATKLYGEISNMRNKFPGFLLEEKKELDKEIFLFYEKLHDKIDLKFINDFKDSITKVNNIIRDAFSSLTIGDIEKAKLFYGKALESYKSLPNGFLPEKMELGAGLLKLYKDLSIQTQIKELQQQLSGEARGSFRYASTDDKLRHLSEVIRRRDFEREGKAMRNETLFSNLIARKLDRAKTSLRRGLYAEAKKNIDAVLKVNPDNLEAKQMLNSLPAQI